METDQLSKLHDLLGTFSTAMLVTHASRGGLRARPMALVEIEESCRMWFITSEETAKVHEVEHDTRVLVVCQKGNDCHLSVNGVAHLEKDRARIEKVWHESFKIWFPDGKEDPHIVLIGVDPTDAEYWDNRGTNKVSFLLKAASAYIGGKRAEANPEQHGRVVLMP